jgi:hypothetical protein
MASVQELKEALIIEQNKTIELAEKSFQAIDTITNNANFWLSALSIGLAVLGLFGVGAVWYGAQRLAKSIAEERIKSYLGRDEASKFVRKCIEDEIRSQIEGRSFVFVQPNQSVPLPNMPAFPNDPQQGKEPRK